MANSLNFGNLEQCLFTCTFGKIYQIVKQYAVFFLQKGFLNLYVLPSISYFYVGKNFFIFFCPESENIFFDNMK